MGAGEREGGLGEEEGGEVGGLRRREHGALKYYSERC